MPGLARRTRSLTRRNRRSRNCDVTIAARAPCWQKTTNSIKGDGKAAWTKRQVREAVRAAKADALPAPKKKPEAEENPEPEYVGGLDTASSRCAAASVAKAEVRRVRAANPDPRRGYGRERVVTCNTASTGAAEPRAAGAAGLVVGHRIL